MLRIFKGDDTDFADANKLRITIGTSVVLAGCRAEFNFLGVTRRIPDASTGTFEVAFTSAETAGMPLGVHCATIRVFDSKGRLRTVTNTLRIEVTDNVDMAYSGENAADVDGHLVVKGIVDDGYGVPAELQEDYTPDEMRAFLNRVAALLRNSMPVAATMILLAFAPAFGAEVEYARFGSIRATSNVVTHVDISSKADKTNTYTKAETDARIVELAPTQAETDPTVPQWSKAPTKPTYTASEVGAATKDEMDTVWNFLMAENFRVTITNYDSTAHAPESSYEFRMSTNEPWRIVWTETNGLARAHTAATNDALKAAKAEIAKPENRAWGRYDSTTGAPAPEGIVQVSAEGGLMIGGGMGYTSVAASGGEYWVLTSTDPTICRTGKNGVFEIIDSSGNAAVSVRKGDKRLVPAPAGGISITANEITIVYSIESAEHPEIECSATLTGGGTWYTPGEDGAPFGAATWSGSSGAWSVTIPKSGAQMGFLRASYYTGGGTVVSYGEAAIEMPKIKIGNVEYKVGTATISGHTVLTLTP